MPQPARSTGTVKWFSDEKGYGFITSDDGGADLFVHFKEIRRVNEGRRNLSDGERVEFTVTPGRVPGRSQASDVVVLS